MKCFYVFLLLNVNILINAQSVQIRGKVIDSDKQPVNNLSVRFTSFGEAVTTGSGEFIISIPMEVRFVDIAIKDDNRKLLYPVDARIPIPSDLNFVTTIIVSGIGSAGYMSMEKSISKFNELETLLKEVGTTNTELKAFLEKFIELESSRLAVSESKFREEFERKEKKISTFTEISRILNEYILRTENLKTTFNMYYEIAYVSNPATENLNKAIRAYNPVYDSIFNNYVGWTAVIKMVRDSSVAENFSSSINYLIEEVHKPYIFQLNEVTKLINEIRFGVNSEDLNKKKNEAKQKINSVMENLEERLPILSERFNIFLNNLLAAE